MKIIRILIGLNFIIFILPFFNACSNIPLRRESEEIINGIKQSKDLSYDSKIELIKNENERFVAIKKSNDSKVLNAYELGIMPFKNIEKAMFREPFFYFSLSYTFQIISSILLLFLVWRNKYKIALQLIVLDICVLFVSLLIQYFDDMFMYLDQIKIGFYFYLINMIIIYLMIIIERKNTKAKKIIS